MFIKNFISEKTCLTLVIIQKMQRFMMILIKKLLVLLSTVKDEYGGVNIDQFIGLKSKMYSTKKNIWQ